MSEATQHLHPGPESKSESKSESGSEPGAESGAGGPTARVTFRGYATGFVVSAALTAMAFWLVLDKVITGSGPLIVVLLALALVQIVVHMVYFLHMNGRSENGWNLLALIFTAILVFILLNGSIWIMYHLDRNLMPMTAAQSRNLP